MRAEGDVGYVRAARITDAGGVTASHKLYRALVRYDHNHTRPNLGKFRSDLAEL